MIGDLLLVFGGFLGGVLLTVSFVNWDYTQWERERAIRRHPTHQSDDLDVPDWLD